ncbi:MAG: hypothetical protein ACXABD_14980, partial [Candidatus Thorarchaeota archaeon]
EESFDVRWTAADKGKDETYIEAIAFALRREREETKALSDRAEKMINKINKYNETSCIHCHDRLPAFCRQCMREAATPDPLAERLERLLKKAVGGIEIIPLKHDRVELIACYGETDTRTVKADSLKQAVDAALGEEE